MRWVQSAAAQDMCRHRRGGGLAMHSGDDNAALAKHYRRQGFGSANRWYPAHAGIEQDRIVLPDRRRENNQLRITGVLGPVRGGETQPELREPLGLERLHLVR